MLFRDCCLMGLLAVVLGVISEKILSYNECKDNFLSRMKQQNKFRFILTLFIFGAVVHYAFDYVGFEAYCEKRCIDNVCSYSCGIRSK